jgi:large subunit ribosomal protein L9
MVKVILKEDIPGLGKAGDVKQVRDGFARNYLFPNSLALTASAHALQEVAAREKKRQALRAAEAKKIEAFAEKLKGLSLTIPADVNEDEKLYGGLDAADIAAALSAEGIEVDKKTVRLDAPIKQLGIFDVPVVLTPEITVTLKVWVVKK